MIAPWAAAFKISKVPLPTNIPSREVTGGGRGGGQQPGLERLQDLLSSTQTPGVAARKA